MSQQIIDLCCDPLCSNVAGLCVLLCDKHAGRFVRLAKERNIALEELGLEPLKAHEARA